MKYSMSTWEIPRASPSGFPLGSGYISLYIPPLVTIQIQDMAFVLGEAVLGIEPKSWLQAKRA